MGTKGGTYELESYIPGRISFFGAANCFLLLHHKIFSINFFDHLDICSGQ
jgi:hypothetical protein